MTVAPTDPLLEAVRSGITTFDLGRLLTVNMPQSPNHPPYWHALPRRHGDMVRPDGGSAANDIISMGTHVGTHIDALAHVSQDGKLFGGCDATEAGHGGRYAELGVHTIAPMVRPGILLDVAGALRVELCPGAHEISASELEQTSAAQATPVTAGDVVLIRTGWGRHLSGNDPQAYVGTTTGVPGVSEEGARWLADHGVHAVGSDTIAFEQTAPGAGHKVLPAHRVLLVEHGIYIIEALELEALAAAGVRRFLFVLSPLPLFGATGSPVRPLAVVTSA